jgi:hypothetical protein
MTPSVWPCEKYTDTEEIIDQEVERLYLSLGCGAGNSSHSSATEVKENI